jgi:signal transduction histidine kinase
MKRLPPVLACFLRALPQLALVAAAVCARQSAHGSLRVENAQLKARADALQADVERLSRSAATADREKDEFLATLSHELRTPLNAILGWIQLLRLHLKHPAQQQQHALDVLERNAGIQARTVADLLDMSRIVTGKMHLTMKSVSLETVVHEATEALRPAAAAKEVALHVDACGPLAIVGDRARLRQIVSNLLGNAVKFTPAGGHIDVRLRLEAPNALLQVEDTGIGIAADALPRLFTRFQQANGGLTRPFGGLGLGLAIVRTLVELHGGTIEAASRGRDRGATFTVRLPLARAGV